MAETDYPKQLLLDVRIVRIGSNLIAMSTVGGVPVRGRQVQGGVQFAGGILPVENDTAAELRAVQSLLDLLSRTTSGDREAEDARLGLELELAGSTLQQASAAADGDLFKLPAVEAAAEAGKRKIADKPQA